MKYKTKVKEVYLIPSDWERTYDSFEDAKYFAEEKLMDWHFETDVDYDWAEGVWNIKKDEKGYKTKLEFIFSCSLKEFEKYFQVLQKRLEGYDVELEKEGK